MYAPRDMAKLTPIGLGVAAGAAAVAVGIGSLPLGVFGAATALVTLIYRAAGGGKHRRALASDSMPNLEQIVDTDTRETVEQLREAKASLQKILDDTPPDVMASLTTTLSSVHELEEYAARLIQRSEELARHLAAVDLPQLVTEVKQLNGRMASTRDAEARKTFEEAKNARMDEIRTLKEIKTTKDRIDANLQRVAAVLCALPTKVVHMRALDAQAMDRISGDMQRELTAVGTELETSEKVMKQLGKVTE